MKTAVLTGLNQIEIRDVPPPVIRRPDDVLLRIRRVGVCGSDIHYYTTGRIGSLVVQYPFAIGHECAAEVEAVGPEVRRLQPGSRVAVDPAVPCHGCDQCRAGRHHTCRSLRFLGCPGQLEGCLSETIVMPEECCFPIPDSLPFDAAALVEPLSIGMYAVRQALPMADARIGILGLGPIGLSVMLPAIAHGAAAVYGTDRIASRCAFARSLGATWTGNPDQIDVVTAVRQAEPLLLDVVFECCGQQDALDQAMAMVKPGGKVMIIGIPEFDRYSFAADAARRSELCLQHVRRQNHCVQAALDFVADNRLTCDRLVTHHYPLTELKRAFDLVQRYGDGVIKAMIHMD
jgi:L-iditol 2-dehydrogenase